jgi:hypothetical protein
MELSSLAAILAAREHWDSPRDRKKQQTARPMSQYRKTRCRCGKCRQCLDNARWERIFEEHFADPNYYKDRDIRYSSPLTSL